MQNTSSSETQPKHGKRSSRVSLECDIMVYRGIVLTQNHLKCELICSKRNSGEK